MDFIGWIVILVFALVCAGLSAEIANSKGWDGAAWFFAGFLLGPLGLLAVVGLPDKQLRNYVRALALKLEALEDVNSQKLRKSLDPELIRILDPELVSLLDPKLIPIIIPALLKLVNIKNSKILPNEICLKDEMHNTLIRAYRSSVSSEWEIKFQRAF